mmetsp:Transcript_6293/g.11441  ORF Transcript_6293/g.11441 Transcript_6293/m.11441 type:complete len:237 (+) Transcript_6293:210-920(+)
MMFSNAFKFVGLLGLALSTSVEGESLPTFKEVDVDVDVASEFAAPPSNRMLPSVAAQGSKSKKSKGSKVSKGSMSSASMKSMKGKKSKKSKKGKNAPKYDAVLSNVNCMVTPSTVTVTPTAGFSAVIFATSPNTEVYPQTLVDIATNFGQSQPHNTAVVIEGKTAIITGTAFTATSGESSLEISYIQEDDQETKTPLSIHDEPVKCTVFIDSFFPSSATVSLSGFSDKVTDGQQFT